MINCITSVTGDLVTVLHKNNNLKYQFNVFNKRNFYLLLKYVDQLTMYTEFVNEKTNIRFPQNTILGTCEEF